MQTIHAKNNLSPMTIYYHYDVYVRIFSTNIDYYIYDYCWLSSCGIRI